MSDRPLSLFKLCIAIAAGVWLGFIAIALTAWLASRYLFPQSLAPVAQAVQQLGKPSVRTVPTEPAKTGTTTGPGPGPKQRA